MALGLVSDSTASRVSRRSLCWNRRAAATTSGARRLPFLVAASETLCEEDTISGFRISARARLSELSSSLSLSLSLSISFALSQRNARRSWGFQRRRTHWFRFPFEVVVFRGGVMRAVRVHLGRIRSCLLRSRRRAVSHTRAHQDSHFSSRQPPRIIHFIYVLYQALGAAEVDAAARKACPGPF